MGWEDCPSLSRSGRLLATAAGRLGTPAPAVESLPAEHGANADARRAVDVGEHRPQVVRYLTVTGAPAQLHDALVHLPQPGRADRFTVGQTAPSVLIGSRPPICVAPAG